MFHTMFPALYKKKWLHHSTLFWLEKRHSGAPEQADTGLGKAVPTSFSCSLPLRAADVQRLQSYTDNLWKHGEKSISGP